MSQAIAELPLDLGDAIEHLVTEDDEPVDNLFSAKQQRLLVNSLYASWAPPPSRDKPKKRRKFLADVNVGIFFALHQSPLVPDFFLSLDVEPHPDWYAKEHRSYFVWEFGKVPEVVIEIVSNRKGGAGLTDIYLYDRREGRLVPEPRLNSPYTEVEPSLNADGSLVAFASQRPDGLGGRDIYLFDRRAGQRLPLPGLNTAAHEYSPSLSADGRFLAFVSERVDGEGERDVYLYDRQAQRLLPTPGLNSKTEDFDPCVVVLKAAE